MATLVSPLSCLRSSLAAAAAAAVRFPIARASFRCSSSTTEMETEHYKFGAYKIDEREVFYSTHLSYALVNLRPLLPGNYSSFICNFIYCCINQTLGRLVFILRVN
ncbi:putative HIT-like superfamily protein [Helianthus anomalus]